jgi:hypothetical protein
MTGQELAKELERLVNNYNTEERDAFVEGFLRMHPTLMQSAFGLMLKCVEAMANKEYVDGRNQASKETAQLIIKGYKQAMVEKLLADPTGYWTREKAEEHVNSDYFKLHKLPLI